MTANRVYAVEWCECRFETGFAVESLHRSKRGAVKAMIAHANRRFLQAACPSNFVKKCRGEKHLEFALWRVREYLVND